MKFLCDEMIKLSYDDKIYVNHKRLTTYISIDVDEVRNKEQLTCVFIWKKVYVHHEKVSSTTKAPLFLLFTIGLITFNILTLLFPTTFSYYLYNTQWSESKTQHTNALASL